MNRRYQRIATTIASAGNRNPANADFGGNQGRGRIDDFTAQACLDHANAQRNSAGAAPARGDTGDPYDWLAAAVPPEGVVLDVACGSAPLRPSLPGRAYVGVDLSAAELAVARRHGADGLVRASATALPLASGSVDVVVCSMALQVLTPLPAALAEIARVLKSGGRLVATVPDRGPLRVTDVPVLAGLLAALGRGLGYPNDNLLARLPDLLPGLGLRLVADERQRFHYRLADAGDADLFLASLYLPDLPAYRYRMTQALLRSLARVGVGLPVPIRRMVASRR